MNSPRGSTLSPIKTRNISSAAAGVGHADSQQHAVGRIECRIAQLLRVHFAQPFKSRDLQALLAGGADRR